MTSDVVFLSLDDVVAIHQDTIEHEGGASGVRDIRLLASAAMMPQQSFDDELLHPDLPSMAAAYLFHIRQNHPFVDGNKRTAAASALVFLRGNGTGKLPDPTALRDITLGVASGGVSKQQLVDWMRKALN
jgi:death-on-curing protein